MKITTWKNQTTVDKVFEVDAYDLMTGTVEDILEIMDEVNDMDDREALFIAFSKHQHKIWDLILDIFPDMTKEDVRRIKLKELIPFFLELFDYVGKSFSGN